MVQNALFCLIFFFSLTAFGMEIDPKVLPIYESLSFGVAHDLKRAKMGPRRSRDLMEDFIYPRYYISELRDRSFDWQNETHGITILNSDATEEFEQKKIEFIQSKLKELFGEAEYTQRMLALEETYSFVDVQFFSFPKSDRQLDGCISVQWEAFLSGTMHACGLLRVEDGHLVFEIREYGDNNPGTLQDQAMRPDDAKELLEMAVVALTFLYEDPYNQILLEEALSQKGRIVNNR